MCLETASTPVSRCSLERTATTLSGGEAQRKDAFHLGINLILYAMTENYKEDLIHVPFIRKRLTR